MARHICYVHVGTGKTGTSAIQYALTRAHDYLLEHGFLYPDISGNFQYVLEGKPTAGNASVVNNLLREQEDERALELLRPFSDRPENLVLSCEGISNRRRQCLESLAGALRAFGYDIRCLVIFRPQVDMVVSSFLQQIKSDKAGTEPSLSARVKRLFGPNGPEAGWNWYLRAQKLEGAFGREALTVKWYPALVRGGPTGVVKAAFDWLGLRLPDDHSVELGKIINPTPGRETMEILQRLNSQGQGGKNFADKFLITAQKEGLLGGKVTLGPSLAGMVVSATRDSNARLLERYCPELSVNDELQPPVIHDEEKSVDAGKIDRLMKIATDILRDSPAGAMRRPAIKRGGSGRGATESIEQNLTFNPELLDGIPKGRAVPLLMGVFDSINDAVSRNEKGWVEFSGLGRFRTRNVTSNRGGQDVLRTRVAFQPDVPDADSEDKEDH